MAGERARQGERDDRDARAGAATSAFDEKAVACTAGLDPTAFFAEPTVRDATLEGS